MELELLLLKGYYFFSSPFILPVLPVYLSLLSNSTNENETKTSFFILPLVSV